MIRRPNDISTLEFAVLSGLRRRSCRVAARRVSIRRRRLPSLRTTKSPSGKCSAQKWMTRAVVWFIRFRALTAWCARTETVSWLRSQPSRTGHACELAASFELNERWEFDTDRFRSAVHSVAARHEPPAHAR